MLTHIVRPVSFVVGELLAGICDSRWRTKIIRSVVDSLDVDAEDELKAVDYLPLRISQYLEKNITTSIYYFTLFGLDANRQKPVFEAI
jgi:hypothetical protein